MNYVIPEELAQALLNYLAQRPYAEVFQLVSALQTLEEENGKQGSSRKRA